MNLISTQKRDNRITGSCTTNIVALVLLKNALGHYVSRWELDNFRDCGVPATWNIWRGFLGTQNRVISFFSELLRANG